jgi:hypothetical protein
MSDAPLFQNVDEQEAIYAPHQVPGADVRARVEGDTNTADLSAANEPPAAAPVSNVGTSPSGVAAPPNIGPDSGNTAPGDPGTQAHYPLNHDDRA